MAGRLAAVASWLRLLGPHRQAAQRRTLDHVGQRLRSLEEAVAAQRKQQKAERQRVRKHLRTHIAAPNDYAELTSAVAQMARRLEQLAQRVEDLTEQTRVGRVAAGHALALAANNREWAAAVPALRGVLDADRVAAHLRAAIGASRLEHHPMPHIVVEEALPRDTYQALIDYLPPRALFEGLEGRARKSEVVLPMRYGPDATLLAWDLVYDLTQRAVIPALLERFRGELRAYVHSLVPSWPVDDAFLDSLTTIKEARIFLRGPGYSLLPHRDPKWGFVTSLLYLARPGDREDFGTALYAVDDDAAAARGGVHYPLAARCRHVKTVPFRANTMLAFLNSVGAHGASVPADADPATERYLYSLRFGPDIRTRDALSAAIRRSGEHGLDVIGVHRHDGRRAERGERALGDVQVVQLEAGA